VQHLRDPIDVASRPKQLISAADCKRYQYSNKNGFHGLPTRFGGSISNLASYWA